MTLSAYAFNEYGHDAKLYNGVADLERERDEWKRKAEATEAERDEAVRKMTARERKWDVMKNLTRSWHDLYHDMKRQLAAVTQEYADYRKQQELWREEEYRQIAAAREDSARLDWMSRNWAFRRPVDDVWLSCGTPEAIRATVDAAREKGGAK